MTLDIQTIISCLDLNKNGNLQGALSLVFPIIDNISGEKFPSINGNKARMVKYFDEVFNDIYILFNKSETNLITPSNIIFKTEIGDTIGEVLYSLRCQILHESNCDYNIQFEDDVWVWCYRDAMNKEYIKFRSDLAIMLLFSALVYHKNINFKNRRTANIIINGKIFDLAKIIGNPVYLKNGLYNIKHRYVPKNDRGIVTIILKNSKIGGVSSINESSYEITYTD
jgi:hypothetical protein